MPDHTNQNHGTLDFLYRPIHQNELVALFLD
jgi:hypothetical protein